MTKNIYEVTRQTAAAMVKMQRDLFDVGLIATAQKVNAASQRLGWEMAEVVEKQERAAKRKRK